jgi:hypothetical protein
MDLTQVSSTKGQQSLFFLLTLLLLEIPGLIYEIPIQGVLCSFSQWSCGCSHPEGVFSHPFTRWIGCQSVPQARDDWSTCMWVSLMPQLPPSMVARFQEQPIRRQRKRETDRQSASQVEAVLSLMIQKTHNFCHILSIRRESQEPVIFRGGT